MTFISPGKISQGADKKKTENYYFEFPYTVPCTMSAVTTQSDRQNCHQTMEECGASVIKEDKQERRQDCSHCKQGEGEDKTGSLSPSFQGEVQLTREFAQLEGMSSLLGIGHLKDHPVNHLKTLILQNHFTVKQRKMRTIDLEHL